MRARGTADRRLRRIPRPAGRQASWMPAAASGCCARRCCGRLRRASYTGAGVQRISVRALRLACRARSRASARGERFDLVICYDVLQYLSAAAARRGDRESGAAVPRRAVFRRAHTRGLARQLRSEPHAPHPGVAAGQLVSARTVARVSADRLRHVAQARSAADACGTWTPRLEIADFERRE